MKPKNRSPLKKGRAAGKVLRPANASEPPTREAMTVERRETILATYRLTCSYQETARILCEPKTTVWDTVQAGIDDPERERIHKTLMARFAAAGVEKMVELMDVVTPANLGSERNSQGSEAARAMADVSRAIAPVLQQDVAEDKTAAPPNITVNVGWPKPVDAKPAEVQDSTATPPEGEPKP